MLDPYQAITAAAAGVSIGLIELAKALLKRRKNGSAKRQERQSDRIEAKVDRVVEDVSEVQHRLSRIEDVMGFTPTGRRRIRALGED